MIAARLDFFLPTKMIDHFSGEGLYLNKKGLMLRF